MIYSDMTHLKKINWKKEYYIFLKMQTEEQSKEEMDELLFLSIKNDLGNRVFYRSPSVLSAPDSKAQAIEVIINEESMWDLALEEYMNHKWSIEKVHHHEMQME